jgi:uncharacterized protein (DUF952 family)
MNPPAPIYNLCRRPDWEAAEKLGRYEGSANDRRDGFIHFSTAAQVAESALRHRAGVPDLLLLAVDPARLGAALRWEPSRGGQLFPHLYGPLRIGDVAAVHALPLGPDGRHVFPPHVFLPSVVLLLA